MPTERCPGVVRIVSDDAAVRRSLSILLRLEGHEVSSAGLIGAAPGVAVTAPAGCCLVIDDRRRHGQPGLGVVEALARAGNAWPVVLLADLPIAAFRRRARAARVVAVLKKPAMAEAIVWHVARALHGAALR